MKKTKRKPTQINSKLLLEVRILYLNIKLRKRGITIQIDLFPKKNQMKY